MKKQLDPLAVTNKKRPDTTMYEVNDSGREMEGSSSTENYIPSFISFIESLGYEVELKWPECNGLEHYIIINGEEFQISTKNASYTSRNPFSRKRIIRKPENRYIAINTGMYNAGDVVRIHFNKEYETAKIKSKIDKAIQAQIDRKKSIEDRLATDKKNTITVAMHYLNNEVIKQNVEYINISEKLIRFICKGIGAIIIHPDGKLNTVCAAIDNMTTMDQVVYFANHIADQAKTLEAVTAAVLTSPQLPADLIEWSLKQYHLYFYTDTMSTERN